MAFSIKIYEKDKYMYSLMKARLGALYPEAYITDPYLGNGSDTDGDMFGEFTKILYNPEQFGKEFSQGSVLDEMQSLKECLDNPIPTTGPDGLIDCRNICSALGIKPTRSRDTSGDSKVSGKGRLEVLIPFVYITDRENYIRNNYSGMADADLSLRLDFTSRYRAPEDDGAGILAGNMTGLLEDCVSKRFEPDDILKYCSRNSMGFLTPGAVKNEDDVYDLGSTRCRLLLDKCRDLVSDNTRKINVLAIAEGFRNSEIPMLVSGCDKVTVLFSGKDFNEEAAAANLISAINRSLTHGVAVADYLKYPTAVKSKPASAAGRTTGITGAAV